MHKTFLKVFQITEDQIPALSLQDLMCYFKTLLTVTGFLKFQTQCFSGILIL